MEKRKGCAVVICDPDRWMIKVKGYELRRLSARPRVGSFTGDGITASQEDLIVVPSRDLR
jgi:hypothetical protein